MKSIKLLAIMLILTCFLGTAYAATPAGKMNNQKPVFIENKGQWPAEVKFLAKSPGMNTWITNTGVVYDVYKYDQKPGNQNALKSRMRKDPREFVNNLPTRSGHVIKMEWLKDKSRDAIQASRIDGIDLKAQNLNYFKGKDKSKWASKVPSYSEVMVNTSSQGFRTRYYFEGNKVRYDYILNPGADISNIKMNFDFGADHQYRAELSSNGELVLKSSVGDIVHGKLFVYQNTDDNKKAEISCNFHINKDSSIGFNVGQYDKTKELIIDPLVYSTYFGGSSDDFFYETHLDSDDNLIFSGFTYSSDYPYTTGAYLNQMGNGEGFITKLNSDLTEIMFSSIFGGSDIDGTVGLDLDNSGNIFVGGITFSNDFPLTSDAIDIELSVADGFVMKFNPDCSELIYSSYIGGDGYDQIDHLVVSSEGSVFIEGMTEATNYPTTPGAFQITNNGNWDFYVTKFSTDLTSLEYSTFVGGSDYDGSWAALLVDEYGQAYITGCTISTDYPYTSDAFDNSYNGGDGDTFLTVLNSDGTGLVYSTYLGGAAFEQGYDMKFRSDGSLVLFGGTGSEDFPVTTNAYDLTFNGGTDYGVQDFTLTVFSEDLQVIEYSTFLGGASIDLAQGVNFTSDNMIFMVGATTSADFPVSADAFDNVFTGTYDACITLLDISNNQLIYSTFLGGEEGSAPWGWDDAMNLYIMDNQILICGYTTSPDFPITDDALDNTLDMGDNFFTILELNLPPEAKCKPATLSLGSNGTVTITPEDIDDGSTGTELSFDIEPSQLTCDNFGDNDVTLTVTDLYGNTSSCNTTVTLSGSAPNCGIAVSPSPAITNGQANTIYLGFGPQSLTLTASGGVSYEWSDGNSIISTNSSVSVSPTQTTTYTLTAYDSYSCTAECTVTINVLDYTTGNNQMYICHRGTTQRVGKSSVQSHLNHGDYLGPCTNGKEGEGDEPETSEFTLSSNFPNPFSKSTMIEYTLPEAGFVQVKVFDVLSNEVAVLVSQSQSAGHYDIEFNGSGLVPGVYIVRIESQGKSDMMKIVKTE